MRTALARAGRGEGGRRPTVLVVGGPLDAMVAVHWRRRVERGAGLRWRRLWSEMAARDALPPAVDLAAVAEDWSRRVPAETVHVLLAGTTGEALRLAGDLVGASPREADPARANAVDTDLLRLLNQALATAPAASRLRWVDGDLAGHLHRPWTGVPGTPTAQLDWALARAGLLADALGAGPWQVHGDVRQRRTLDRRRAGTLGATRRDPGAGARGAHVAGGRTAVADRVILHVGAPKTGTSFLQDRALPQPGGPCRDRGSATRPTGPTPTSWPRST